MRIPGSVLAVVVSVAFAGCAPEDVWTTRVEESEPSPEPPEHLLRLQPDFRLYESHIRKEFFLYFYEDESVREEIVTVINHSLPQKERRPRLATPEEHDFAIAIFLEDWRARGQEEKIRYFNQRHAMETQQRNSLIDLKIQFKEAEILELEERKLSLEADLKSRQQTGTFNAGSEKFRLADTATVQRELAKTGRLLLLAQGQKMILDHLRGLRDGQFARQVAVLVEKTMAVEDLLARYDPPELLVDEIRKRVQPQAWERSNARIEIRDNALLVVQTREVILAIRDYLERLRVPPK